MCCFNATRIWGDFKAEILTPIVFFSIDGTSASYDFSNEFSNISIYGCENYPHIKLELIGDNLQIGFASVHTLHNLVVDKVTAWGTRYGISVNNSYFAQISNCSLFRCHYGIYSIQSHAGIWQNNLADHCYEGYAVRSGQILLNSCNSEQSQIGIHLYHGGNTVKESYLGCIGVKSLGQIIVGSKPSDEWYSELGVNATTCEGLTIAVAEELGNGGEGIIMEEKNGLLTR